MGLTKEINALKSKRAALHENGDLAFTVEMR